VNSLSFERVPPTSALLQQADIRATESMVAWGQEETFSYMSFVSQLDEECL
jgi:hypothetical protein